MFSSGGSSMFGTNKTFGSTAATGGLFGSTSTNQPSFGFASAMMDAGPEGTTIPFEPVRGTDTMMKNGDAKDISTKLMCVTAMDKYKGRCLEELRVFDYAANRKGPQAGGSTFGQTNTGGGLFGSQKPSIFGSQTSAFGSTTSTPFGGTSAFGQATKPAFGSTTTPSGGLFGSTTANIGTSNVLFGGANTNSTGVSLFGQTNSAPAFGQTNTGTTTLFGNKPAFGSTGQSQTQTSLFQKPTTTNLFNQPAATSASTGFGFGTTTSSTSSGFGPFGGTATSAANNPFSAKPATAAFSGFGTSTGGATGSIFGNNQSTSSNLFANANKPATAGLFGSQQSATGNTPFGTSTAASNSIFGSMNKPAPLFGPNNTGSVFNTQNNVQPAATTTVISQTASPPIILGGNIDEASLQRKLIEAQLGSMPYGDSPLLKDRYGSSSSAPTVSLSKSDDPDIQSRLRKLASQAIVGADTSASFNGGTPLTKLNNESLRSAVCSPHNSFSYKPLVPLPALGFAPNERSSLNLSLRRSPPKIAPSKNILNMSASSVMSPRSFDPSVLKIKNNTSVLNTESSAERSNQNISDVNSPTSPTAITPDERRRSVVFADGPNLEKISEIQPVRLDFDSLNDSVISSKNASNTPNQQPLKSILVTAESRKQKEEQRKLSTSATHDEIEQNLNSTPVSPVASRNISKSPESPTILNRSNASLNEADEYFTEPPLEELEKSMRDRKIIIKNGLTVGRKGYGSVYWPGSFELSSLDFENMVFFRSKEVTVYPDENNKPPIGVDLNRPAEISLQGVWPFDKVTRQFIKDPVAMGKLRFRNRLELVCERMDAKFIDYQVKTGTWTFSVSHFSKYGLVDDDEEVNPEELNAILKQQEQMLRVQRAAIPKKLPLKEIQSTYIESNNFFRAGLGGNLDAPKVKIEQVEYDVDMSDSLFPSTTKRIRHDPLIPDVLDQKFFPTPKEDSYIRRKLVQRRILNNEIMSIKNDHKLQHILRKIHGLTPTILQNNPRLQWHPSNSDTLVKADHFQRHVNLYKIHLVPMLRDYFLNILTSDGRVAELEKIVETDSLKFSPPSVMLQLLDSYLLTLKKNRGLDQVKVDAEIDQLLRALLVSPNSPDYKVQQRNRFSGWIKSKLLPDLKQILDNYSVENQSEASRIIFECLIHGSVKDAINVALEFKLYNLSLILSLYHCPNSMQCKESLAAQHYESERIFKQCKDEYFMKIYQLLAGPKSIKGTKRPDDFYDCLKSLSWFQVVGVFLWYASSPSDGLTEWSTFYKQLASTGQVSEVL